MPNWTDNKITIKGSKELLDAFVEDGRKGTESGYGFSFYSWRPIPETYLKYDTTNHPNGDGLKVGDQLDWMADSPVVTEELIEEYNAATKEQEEKYGVVGWYDWNVQNIGCKWNEEFSSIDRISDNELQIRVTTPWCAPLPFCEYIVKSYKGIVIEIASHYEDNANYVVGFNEDGEEVYLDADEYKSELKSYIESKLESEDSRFGMLKEFIDNDYWYITLTFEDNWHDFLGFVDMCEE